MERLACSYFRFKRGLLQFVDLFIPSKVMKKNLVSWATFPRFDLSANLEKYDKRINVAFCFNERYIPLALTSIMSLLENSPACSYDIYCVTDITAKCQKKLRDFVMGRHSNVVIRFLKPNNDFDNAFCGRWSNAIWWRCMLPKLLPESVERIIYADVDTLFLRDLREANEFDVGTNLLAGCFDSPTYINSGFLVMNIVQFRIDDVYSKMISWAETNQTRYPDQDMLNAVCKGRIKSMSRKFNAIVGGGYSFLKTMDLTLYREMRQPVMLHYAGKIKPWDMMIKSFFTFRLYRKYYNLIQENY